jgi:hypothetical protein
MDAGKQSFRDKCVPKLELGNEAENGRAPGVLKLSRSFNREK